MSESHVIHMVISDILHRNLKVQTHSSKRFPETDSGSFISGIAVGTKHFVRR